MSRRGGLCEKIRCQESRCWKPSQHLCNRLGIRNCMIGLHRVHIFLAFFFSQRFQIHHDPLHTVALGDEGDLRLIGNVNQIQRHPLPSRCWLWLPFLHFLQLLRFIPRKNRPGAGENGDNHPLSTMICRYAHSAGKINLYRKSGSETKEKPLRDNPEG